jgi:hypothetical protein
LSSFSICKDKSSKLTPAGSGLKVGIFEVGYVVVSFVVFWFIVWIGVIVLLVFIVEFEVFILEFLQAS